MKTVWIGLVDVSPAEGSQTLSSGALGAYVNALAFVCNRYEYERNVREALSELLLTPGEFEDVEPLEQRLGKFTISTELHELAEKVAETGEVKFGSFYNYVSLGLM
jgi:hypothetical protein